MGFQYQNTSLVGTEALPIVLGANGSATDVWTWTHNRGAKAAKISILDAVTRQPVAPASIVPGGTLVGECVIVNTNSTTVIAIQNQAAGGFSVILEVVWQYPSAEISDNLLASLGVLS